MNNDNIIKGVKCPKCKDTIFSRSANDRHKCTCGSLFIAPKLMYGCDSDIDFDEIEVVEIDTNDYPSIDLYNACNMPYMEDSNNEEIKYGFIYGRMKEGNEDG